VLKWDVFSFGFLQVLSRISPVVLGDPQGCPRQIDNVVWIDSWLSIAGAGCGLTGVGAGEEQARKVVAGEAS
jgi:hypothetical protein